MIRFVCVWLTFTAMFGSVQADSDKRSEAMPFGKGGQKKMLYDRRQRPLASHSYRSKGQQWNQYSLFHSGNVLIIDRGKDSELQRKKSSAEYTAKKKKIIAGLKTSGL